MQYERNEPKASKLTIRADRAVGGSMRQRGAHVDAIGFNIQFILERKPLLAAELFRIWREASDLGPDDPKASEGEMRAAVVEFERLVGHPIM